MFFRLLYRIPWLLFHLIIGLPITVIAHTSPFKTLTIGSRRVRDIFLHWWSGTTCSIFGLDKQVTGAFPPGAQLVVANHISWLDIELLHSVSPMGFVAKAEIQKWPIAGWIAGFGDTVYHHRGSHDSASGVASVMAERLESGSKVAIFAEGGILPGHGVKRFHARMFAAAQDTGTEIQPVMIRYVRDGAHVREMTFLPGESFIANFFRLLGQKTCRAELAILEPIAPAGLQRKQLAAAAEAAVKTAFDDGLVEERTATDV